METEFLEEYINNPALQAKYGNFSEYRDFMSSQQPSGITTIPNQFMNNITNSLGSGVDQFTGQISDLWGGLQNKLGGAWGKTKELGSRFKEGAAPVFGLVSMIGNATNPLNPKSFNYNPDLAAQLNFMDENFGGSMVNNPSSGLLQYSDKVMLDGELVDNPLRGQNVMSMFGSNDPVKQLEKQLARRQKTYDNLGNQWSSLSEEDLAAKKQRYFDKFLSPTTNWLDKVKEDQKVRIDKRNTAAAIKEAEREARREDARNTAKIEAYTGQKMSDYRASRPRSERNYTGAGKSGMGRDNPYYAHGGRVRYANGGLASLFTRRG